MPRLVKRIKRLLCRHDRTTYHGHPDAPLGLCLDCGTVRGPRKRYLADDPRFVGRGRSL